MLILGILFMKKVSSKMLFCYRNQNASDKILQDVMYLSNKGHPSREYKLVQSTETDKFISMFIICLMELSCHVR